jgi:uncharacterized membrane protein YvlD (DUF360 family)
MKRLTATTIILGVLAVAFLIPAALLVLGGFFLIISRTMGGISAGAGGFSFSFSRSSARYLVLILMLAAFISWITQKILRRQNSRR